jgi:hypothetical protein
LIALLDVARAADVSFVELATAIVPATGDLQRTTERRQELATKLRKFVHEERRQPRVRS